MTHADANAAMTASWAQLERAVERIHAAARDLTGASEFYGILLQEAADVLAATGGAAWQVQQDRPPAVICQHGEAAFGDEPPSGSRQACALKTVDRRVAAVEPATAGRGDLDYLYCPVDGSEKDLTRQGNVAAIIELWLPAANPLAHQGWLDFASTLADIAAEFHVRAELRRLRAGADLRDQAIALLSRVQAPPTVTGAAFEIANEGRRLLDCDRLSVLVRRGRRWRLVAVSGVDRAAPRTEFTRRTESLADQVARWGEPLSSYGGGEESLELPPRLKLTLGEHMDHSHARVLAAAPFGFASSLSHIQPERARRSRRSKPDVVLIAERFTDARSSPGADDLRQQLVELGELCVPALARTANLDRFPMRQLLRWTSWMKALRQPMALLRTAAVVGSIAAAFVALVFVPYDFTVEAPAALHAAVEREIFATTTGTVAEIRVVHGQLVAAGEVLAVLEDPELSLKLQQVRGEIDAARQRLATVVVSRTQRTLRENSSSDELPISAEQPQLEQRIAGLELQRELLERRRAELVLRSPLAGQVLTRDVQSLLESRPVERGEVLLTIADTSRGWMLEADIAQRDIGHVLTATQSDRQALPVEYRLAGDVQRHYPGRLVSIDAAAPLDAGGLRDEPPTVKARIAIDGVPPAAARPGMTASVRIDCGERAIGYVWLHDVGATLYRWATF